jgi:hypothetical protein
MADTLSIRLAERDREILEAEARRSGTGLSTLVRTLAEMEAKRLRYAAICAEFERHMEEHPPTLEALAEMDGWSAMAFETLPDEVWSGWLGI